jgi:hypothetical protein
VDKLEFQNTIEEYNIRYYDLGSCICGTRCAFDDKLCCKRVLNVVKS